MTTIVRYERKKKKKKGTFTRASTISHREEGGGGIECYRITCYRHLDDARPNSVGARAVCVRACVRTLVTDDADLAEGQTRGEAGEDCARYARAISPSIGIRARNNAIIGSIY